MTEWAERKDASETKKPEQEHVFNQNVLCEELRPLLERELARGNAIKEGPRLGWPGEESVFVALRDLSAPGWRLPDGVEHAVNVDRHYDWREDYFCHHHRHVLVCG